MPNTAGSEQGGGSPLDIAVIGASGDLAARKIYPALFALYCQGLLPENVRIAGYARSGLGAEAFRNRIMQHLTCRYVPGEQCDEKMAAFLACCGYVRGDYKSAQDYRALDKALGRDAAKRIYYFSIPPFLYLDVAQAMQEAGLAKTGEGWPRIVMEKPFGSDRPSFDLLTEGMVKVFDEAQIYRIDHYLGKEVVQNLLVLRFANLIFDPLWNRAHIDDVRITWTETLGLEGRAGYFDEYGIIRDVMQNHLLQIMALIAMEVPIGLRGDDVSDEKVKVLRCVPPVTLDDIVVGQYTGAKADGVSKPGYLEEPGVPADSITPTYAAVALSVRNRRWDGVPFFVRAGKGLAEAMTEIRIRFHEVPGRLFSETPIAIAPNELIIRVQPDPAISLRVTNKAPGLAMDLARSDLDLTYAKAFQAEIPDAYECLILDVINGDKTLFIRADELAAAWDIFTPILQDLEACTIRPQPYPLGSDGPEAAVALAALHGAAW